MIWWKIALIILGIIYLWIAWGFYLFGRACGEIKDGKKLVGFLTSLLWPPFLITHWKTK